MVPTRFWWMSSQVSPEAHRLVSGFVYRRTPVSKNLKKFKKRLLHQTASRLLGVSEPPQANGILVTLIDTKKPMRKRGLRLRWAYEHEVLTKKYLKDVQCCACGSDAGLFSSEPTYPQIEHAHNQLNFRSKKTNRPMHRSAWSSR